ncbi:MAG: hypothetical protein QMC90_04195 [Dehalococcoidales bacterium]|nr:hypothetical protein [Dehalococcoidales bacterium]
MSRLIDKLNRISRATPQVMGFRAAQPASPKPKLLLIANLAQANVDSLADYVAGADAGLLPISNLSSGAKTFQEISQAVPNIPWGVWLRDIGRGGIKEIVKVGCDFVVFPAANTSLAILQDDNVGKILQVEATVGEGLLRTVDELPVDAVLINSEQEGEYFLTWHHLMLFQCFADLLTKPVLVCIPSNVTTNELQALGEAGVDGVIVEVGVAQPVERLNELRQTIDKLPFPSPRKRGKAKALLPYISGEKGIVTEE